jgi:hypothetical protein
MPSLNFTIKLTDLRAFYSEIFLFMPKTERIIEKRDGGAVEKVLPISFVIISSIIYNHSC